MTRFNTRATPPKTTAPIVSVANPAARTANQAPGFVRDPKSELFLLAVTNMVSQHTYYETPKARDDRYAALVRQVAVDDPDWLSRFLPWLRNTANMRTAAVVAGVEAAWALQDQRLPGSRQLISDVLTRADEPGEALAYSKNVLGRKVSGGVMRGIADAVTRLYTQRSTLKYDGTSTQRGYRFGHVIEICHPKPGSLDQNALFRYLITRGKKGSDAVIPDELTMLVANAAIRVQARSMPQVLLNSSRLRMAGINWEDAFGMIGDVSKKDLWEAMIPNMGYMALLRNLRNFDEAGVSDDVAQNVVIPKLTDPAEVAASRQLPMRFLSAYRAAKASSRWDVALRGALDLCLINVPQFSGRTLIMVDTSGSMHTRMSDRSELMYWDAAVLFGLAMAKRCETADVISFSNGPMPFPVNPAESLLRGIERWESGRFFQGGGTNTHGCLRASFKNHDRVVILTDEQANAHSSVHVAAGIVPERTPVITFNLAGYRVGHAPSGTASRVTIGGLTDQAFMLIPALEARAKGEWPF